nr:hypothetical protein [Tanacetum cinerariifolium]
AAPPPAPSRGGRAWAARN